MFATQPNDVEANWQAARSGFRGIATSSVRLGFIKKVYGIVTAQVLTTALVSALFVYGPFGKPILRFSLQNPTLFWAVSFLPTLAVLMALNFNKKNHPVNMYLLGAFTLLISVSVGITCAAVAAAGLGELGVQAAALTGLILGGLTLYVFNTKKNLSYLGAFLFPILFSMSIWGLARIFFPSMRTGIMGLMYSFLGAIVFSGYIVYDTYRIIHMLDIDNYVEGSIQLYLDIINLFLYILDILIKLSKKNQRER